MPFEIQGEDKLEGRVNMRVTLKELERLRLDAKLAGMTLAELLRRRVFGRAIISSSDEATIRELRRLGGLIKKTHIDSGGAYSAQTAELLNQLSNAAIALQARAQGEEGT